jgi:Holliday junction DNA helicase RuvB
VSPATLRVVRDSEFATSARAASEDPALRPTSFADCVGQTEVVGNLREAVRAAKHGGWQLDHVLLAGPAGLGKSSLASIVAFELGAKLHATSAPAIEHKGQLASLLTALGEGDVLFIDEIHAMDRQLCEVLYLAMEDHVLDMPAGKRVIRVPLPKFTLVGATTHPGKLPAPLRDRFGLICQLRPYTLDELSLIVTRSARHLGIAIDDTGALAIARASRGTPRIANRLLRRVRDTAANAALNGAIMRYGDRSMVNGPLALAALHRLGIDQLGIDVLDRRYLALVANRPVGVEALCAALGEDRSTVETLEAYLAQSGLIMRTGKGRVATDAGREHLAGEQSS